MARAGNLATCSASRARIIQSRGVSLSWESGNPPGSLRGAPHLDTVTLFGRLAQLGERERRRRSMRAAPHLDTVTLFGRFAQLGERERRRRSMRLAPQVVPGSA